MEISEEKNINELFSSLPEKVKEWLSSEELVFIITEIENKLGLKDEDTLIIPNLILRLAVQDIEPQNFINTLANELKLDFSVAKTISEEIEQKALRPIASELRQKTGLEVKLIYYSKQPSSASAQKIETSKTPSTSPRETPEPAKPQISSAEKEGPVVDLQSFKIKTDRPLSPLTFAPAMKDEKTTAESLAKKEVLREIPATPFILHQENPTAYPSIRPNGSTAKAGQAGSPQRSQETPAIKSSLTMKVQNFYQSSPGPERTAPKPVSIKFETSPSGFNAPKTEQPININKQDAPPAPLNDSFHESSPELPPMPPTASNSNEIRVVHYSDLRTPLNNLGISKNSVEKDNVLDLRKIVK